MDISKVVSTREDLSIDISITRCRTDIDEAKTMISALRSKCSSKIIDIIRTFLIGKKNQILGVSMV